MSLVMRAISSGLILPQITGQPGDKTNFLFACRMLVPDGGAVVIDCGRTSSAEHTNKWLLISPVLVDARGIPLKR